MDIKKFSIFNFQKGYTLVEIMVAVGIFFILIAAPTGFFVSSLAGQRKALASQMLLDNVSYSLEYISRALRMAKKDLTGSCIDRNMNYKITRDGKGIKFKNYQEVCQEFFWDVNDNRLKETKNEGTAISFTADDLKVITFKIGQVGWSQDDTKQPRVTFFLEMKSIKSKKPEFQPAIKIQTTISQRDLDVRY